MASSELTTLQRVTGFKLLCAKLEEIEQNAQQLKALMKDTEQQALFIHAIFIIKKEPKLKPDPQKVAIFEAVRNVLEKEKTELIDFLSVSGEGASGGAIITDYLIVENSSQIKTAATLKSSNIWIGSEVRFPSYLAPNRVSNLIRTHISRSGTAGFTLNPDQIHCTSPVDLETIARSLSTFGKGLFCAAESNAEKSKKAAKKVLREILADTPSISEYLSGLVIYEQTLIEKREDGVMFVQAMKEYGVLCGVVIEVDGSEGFKERGAQLVEGGIQFVEIHGDIGFGQDFKAVVQDMVRIAALCQEFGLVPVLTPKITTNGCKDLEPLVEFNQEVLHCLFDGLKSNLVLLPSTLLKIGPITSASAKQDIETISRRTLDVLSSVVPSTVKVVFLLSGNFSRTDCTVILNAMNQATNQSQRLWNVSFSFGRALQQRLPKKNEKVADLPESPFDEFKRIVKLNSDAARGQFEA